jgi:hypothetical protein
MPELAFVLAPRQNLFFLELVTALRDELRQLGVDSSVHRGAFPDPEPGRVFAVVPPHEYFTLMHGRVGPPPEVTDRTIYICAEQPGTEFFEWNVEYARAAGAVFDINRFAVRALQAEGIAAEHLQLGWTPAWDHFDRERERDIDVLFMGAASDRRLEHLSAVASRLWDRRCHFVVSDNSRPNWEPSGSFLVEDEKWDLLARSKVLVNIHQGGTPYFEWLRLVQAMSTGCAVVTERSIDYAPLEPGRHFLAGRASALPHLAEYLLGEHDLRFHIQGEAYGMVRNLLPLRQAAEGLAAAVRRLDERPVPSADAYFFRQPPPSEADARAALARVTHVEPEPADGATRRALKDLKLDLMDVRRRLQRIELGEERTVVARRRSRGYHRARPKVSVLLSLFNYAEEVEDALDSLLHSRIRDWEVIVVDDGSGDDSAAVAEAWIERHDTVSALLLQHPVNRGLAAARNSALAFARGELCFVLDADNQVNPNGFDLLIEALERDREAGYAYGMLARVTTTRGPVGLMNLFPWAPERFASGNYIDAMAMVRTDVLRGAHVPAVVARYRMSDHSMLGVTNISGAEATSLIAQAAPTVMAGARIAGEDE